ncbi:MAG: nucleotide exchange factor GrpE, partial [Pseudomonadota bacterium]
MSDENETSDETPEAKPQEPGTEATDEGAPAPGEELLDGTSKTYDELVLENEDLRARLLRAVADAENVRKRAERDQQDTAKYAISKFARDLLSVADNFRRAMDSVPEEDRESANETWKNLLVGI